ncbi:MAG TPA: hypothetical protein VF813_03505 [Anaerolineaceae bacterium]
MPENRCPMCGKTNPPGRDTCQYCQARLTPLIVSPAASTPSEPPDPRPAPPPAPVENPSPAPEPSAPESAGDDWLSALRDVPFEETAPGNSTQPEEDWLSALTTLPEEPAPAASAPLEPPTGEAPEHDLNWLDSIRKRTVSPNPTQDETDWLQSLRSSAEETPPPEAEEEPQPKPAGKHFGGLLSRLWGGESPAGEQLTTEPTPPAAGVPASPAEPVFPPSQPSEPVQPGEMEETSAAFSGLFEEPAPTPGFDFPTAVEPPAARPAQAAPPPTMPPAPPRAAEKPAPEPAPPPSAESLPPVVPPPAPKAPAIPFHQDSLTEWLRELDAAQRSPEPAPRPTSPLSVSDDADDSGGIASAEIPSWVQSLRPVETAAPRSPARPAGLPSRRIEEQGPLAGLRGILPAEPPIPSVSRSAVVSTQLEVSENQERNSRILEGLLAAEDQPAALPAAPIISSPRFVRMILAAVLILALLVPLLGGLQLIPVPSAAPAEVTALQASLETLPVNSPVLLVADYSPAVSGEMQAASSAVLSDLLDRGTRLVVISSLPTGPALADRLLNTITAGAAGKYAAYQAPGKIIHLGYLPGGISSLAAFAAGPRAAAPYTVEGQYAWEQPALQGVTALADFSRVLVLTDSAETGQAWIEQVQPHLGKQAAMLVVSAAQAAPALRPYFDSRQIQGLSAGIAGGAAYEELVQKPGAGHVYWDTYQVGILAAVLIIIAGTLTSTGGSLLAAARQAIEESR